MSTPALKIHHPPAHGREPMALADIGHDPHVARGDRFVILNPQRVPEEYRTRPNLDRDPALVPAKLAECFRKCRTGAAPWPLYAFGPPGTGKSRFALLANDWYGGALFDFSELLAEFIALRRGELLSDDTRVVITPNTRPIREMEWVKALVGPRLFIVDDVGRKNDTDAGTARDLLGKLLDQRQGRPTVILSNFGPEQLARLYDARIVSRCCAGSLLKLTGDDRRLQE